jgi:hypothetical protein
MAAAIVKAGDIVLTIGADESEFVGPALLEILR